MSRTLQPAERRHTLAFLGGDVPGEGIRLAMNCYKAMKRELISRDRGAGNSDLQVSSRFPTARGKHVRNPDQRVHLLTSSNL